MIPSKISIPTFAKYYLGSTASIGNENISEEAIWI